MEQNSISSLYSSDVFTFCRALPKVETHAHLNGCVRNETIRELVHLKLGQGAIDEPELCKLTSRGDRTLSECFRLFDVIHRVTTDHDTIERITREVLADFAQDGCVYLELRTTPKERPEHRMTKASYVQAVLRGMAVFQAGQGNGMVTRLILSIDRREGAADAMRTVQLAVECMPLGVVGIDLSGNPTVGEWDQWHGALLAARKAGLKLTLHCAEVWNPQETLAMIQLPADRLGHTCYLDQQLREALMQSCTPVELCLSSNVITESVRSFEDHHFAEFRAAGHPVCLCTDDTGVFSTCLSQEMAIAAGVHGLSHQQLFDLAKGALQFVFLPQAFAAEWKQLQAAFDAFAASHGLDPGA